MSNIQVVIINLRKSIKDEEKAAANYRARARLADPATAKRYREIADDEDIHRRQFATRLGQVMRERDMSKNIADKGKIRR